MDLQGKLDKLETLDNDKLIDIVKNYKQYGLEEEVRNKAIQILDERGIDEEQLSLSGNLVNQNYEEAERLYLAFLKSSKTAFTFYLVFLFSPLIVVYFKEFLQEYSTYVALFNIASLLAYIVFLIRSFFHQNQFYRMVGKQHESGGALLYFLLGMPLYFFMYFYFVSRMKILKSTIR